MTAESAFERWYLPQEPSTAAHKTALHDEVVDAIGRDAPVRYLEFGVHEGWSISRFASLFTNPAATFTGFDSFVGLPENWGHLEDERVSFDKGWFQNSTPPVFPGLMYDTARPTLVHFDADLYSSTLFLLTSLWWYLPEYFFIFDEFMGHELAATRQFVLAYPVEIRFLRQVKSSLDVPAQVFGYMRRTRMVVDGVE
jgi:hypothetical protein